MIHGKSKPSNIYSELKNLYFNKKYNEFINASTKHLQCYPNETNLRFMRAKSYRVLREYDLAINDLKYILNIEKNKYVLVELFFIYYYLNKYKEALDLLPILYENNFIRGNSLSIAEQVMKTQLGIEIKLKKDSNLNYIRSQIFNYSDMLAMEHIKEHLCYENLENKEDFSYFNNNINIDYLFEIVRKNIKNSKKVDQDEMLEIHFFSVSNVGFYKEDICNFIRVIVVPNTDHIITMYPTNKVPVIGLLSLNIDYEKLFTRESHVKQKSRIDKFNERYKRV